MAFRSANGEIDAVTFEHYLARRHLWEAGLWASYLLISLAAGSAVAWLDLHRSGVAFQSWEPFVWESTSAVTAGLLILLIIRFDRHFPIRPDTWRRNLLAHALFTIPYSLLHVTSMYWMRVGLYRLVGDNDGYWWPNWWREFGYEYLKDFRTYFLFLVIIYLYRFILRRLQGEAEFLSEGQEEVEPVAVTDRFLIKKLGREFLVRVDRIDWIESSGNYVNLHVGAHVYPLRETMAGIGARLAAQGFQRVHRSAIVNLDRVSEITTQDSGDGEIRITSNAKLPLSRRYRKTLRDRLREPAF
jgi:LytTr DNA-binding domain